MANWYPRKLTSINNRNPQTLRQVEMLWKRTFKDVSGLSFICRLCSLDMKDSQWGNMQRMFCPLSNFTEMRVNILYFIPEKVNQMSPGYISPYFVSLVLFYEPFAKKRSYKTKWQKTNFALYIPKYCISFFKKWPLFVSIMLIIIPIRYRGIYHFTWKESNNWNDAGTNDAGTDFILQKHILSVLLSGICILLFERSWWLDST